MVRRTDRYMRPSMRRPPAGLAGWQTLAKGLMYEKENTYTTVLQRLVVR